MSKVFSGHARTPWHVFNDEGSIYITGDGYAELVESVISEEVADGIVLAVNNFDALVAELRRCSASLGSLISESSDPGAEALAAYHTATALLLKCTPEKPKANLLPPSSQSTGDE